MTGLEPIVLGTVLGTEITLGTAIAGIASLGSTFAGIKAQNTQAAGEEAAALVNAQINENNARLVESETEASLEKADRERRQRAGTVRANIGGTGLSLSSFEDTLFDNTIQEELNILTIKNAGFNKAQSFKNSASLDYLKAGTAKKSKVGVGTGILKGVTALSGSL